MRNLKLDKSIPVKTKDGEASWTEMQCNMARKNWQKTEIEKLSIYVSMKDVGRMIMHIVSV